MPAALSRILSIALCCCWITTSSHADAKSGTGQATPRFASLKHQKTNVRVGPGTQYPIRWIYQRQGLPVEIIAEFANWRRIRSSDGSDGWVHTALLSAKRTALAAPWSRHPINMRARPNERAAIVARLQPAVLVDLARCDRTWCSVSVPKHDLSGFVRQEKLWGVYPDELIGRRSR